MSQIPLASFVPKPTDYTEWKSWASDFYSSIFNDLAVLKSLFAERLSFGDGVSLDNIGGYWLKDQTTDGTPDTESSFTHNLGVIPVGILVVKQNKAGVIYAGSSAWTTTLVYLKCSVASTTFTAFLLAPPTEIM